MTARRRALTFPLHLRLVACDDAGADDRAVPNQVPIARRTGHFGGFRLLATFWHVAEQ